MQAISPDGRWRFDDGRIRSNHRVAKAFEIDFHERWTFVRFIGSDCLALAFESSQPWSEHGSYGDRHSPLWKAEESPITRLR